MTRNTKNVEKKQRTPQSSQRHVIRRLPCRRCLSACRLTDFNPKSRPFIYTANGIFRTVIGPVLHVSDKNFIFRREKYLSLSLNYQKRSSWKHSRVTPFLIMAPMSFFNVTCPLIRWVRRTPDTPIMGNPKD